MVSIVPFSSSLDFIKVWNVFMKSLAFLSYLFISYIFKPAIAQRLNYTISRIRLSVYDFCYCVNKRIVRVRMFR